MSVLQETFEAHGMVQTGGNVPVDQALLVIAEDYCHPIPTPEIGESIDEARERTDLTFIEGEIPVAAQRHSFHDPSSLRSWEEPEPYGLTALTVGRYAIVRQMARDLKETDPAKAARLEAALPLLQDAIVDVAGLPRSSVFVRQMYAAALRARRSGNRVFTVIGADHMKHPIADVLSDLGIPVAVMSVRDQRAPTDVEVDAYYARFAALDRQTYKAQWRGRVATAQ